MSYESLHERKMEEIKAYAEDESRRRYEKRERKALKRSIREEKAKEKDTLSINEDASGCVSVCALIGLGYVVYWGFRLILWIIHLF